MKLREWQETAFPLWWNRKRGIVKVVTGGGKTVFAIHCLKQYLEENPNNSKNYFVVDGVEYSIEKCIIQKVVEGPDTYYQFVFLI